MSDNDALLRQWKVPTTLAEREAAAHRRIASSNPERAAKHLEAAEILDPQQAGNPGDYRRDWNSISGKTTRDGHES